MTSAPDIVRRLNRLDNDSLATYELITGLSTTQAKHTQQLTQIESKLTEHDARFDGIDTRFDAVDAQFDAVDARFDGIDTRLKELTSTLQTVVELVTPK